MFLVLRKRESEGPISIVCQGDCEDFIRHYAKYNVNEREAESTFVIGGDFVPIKNYMDVDQSQPKKKEETADAANTK